MARDSVEPRGTDALGIPQYRGVDAIGGGSPPPVKPKPKPEPKEKPE